MTGTISPSAIISHYAIISRIGAGAMGEVYRARDTRLDREVAIKILPAEFTDDSERVRRFIQEARAASALNHPNIISIYDIGECETGRFIVMELVAGKTLRAVIASDNSIETFFHLSVQMARALSSAHAAGITHRDIKPDNIMVRDDGYVKILDFGLARLRPTTASDPEAMTLAQQTKPGTVMGTLAYMSPEQASGQTAGSASDVFALGIVLYELATGSHPFKSETMIGYLHGITAQTPASITGLKPHLPEALDDLILRMLEKDADLRPTAAEVAQGLQEIEKYGSSNTLPLRKVADKPGAKRVADLSTPSIAVLPFVNISNDPDNDYFCDGLAEELLNALAKIGELKVAARTSAFSFRGKSVNIGVIGKSLGVKTVLEGSVRRSADRVRIGVQLINVADGYQIWSERYDREMKDIFDVQDEISLAVVDALKLELFGAEKAAVLKRYTDNAEVHELFLKGRYHHYKYTAEGWKRAIEFFERAIEKEPDYAPAYAATASSRGCLWFFGLLPAHQTIPQCKTAALRALEIDKDLADAHLSLAIITFFYDWKWEQAEEEFKQSIALNPNHAESLSYYAMFLGFEGRIEEALSWDRRALEIDPLSPLINMNVGWTSFSAGRLDEALNQAGKMIEIEPDFYGAYWLKGAIHLSEGEYEAAVAELTRAVQLGGHQIVLADLGSAYSLAGRKEDAARILDQLLEMRRQEYVPAICIARVYCRLGAVDQAIEWLEKASVERNGEMIFLEGEIAGAADSDPLRGLGRNPRLAALLQKMNLPQ